MQMYVNTIQRRKVADRYLGIRESFSFGGLGLDANRHTHFYRILADD